MFTFIDQNLDPVPSDDDIKALANELHMGLLAAATNGAMSGERYARIKKVLTGTHLKPLVPDYLMTCPTPEDFKRYMQGKHSDYKGRRTLITESLTPLLKRIEEESDHIVDNFEQRGFIGEGGFGQVYKYYHKLLDMDFAFKIFAPSFSQGGEGHLERFFREARILFRLHHPNIIKVYDVGMIGKRPYIRMEYFEGSTIQDILKNKGNFSFRAALTIVIEIAKALDYAHKSVKVIHRDLKPSNVMIDDSTQVRIIDFGLGVFVEHDLISRITKTGEQIAGGYYTAPELVGNPKLLDPKSDIYSLGAIWYTMILGRPPAGTNLESQLGSLDGITENYVKCLSKCLEDTSNRYSSCEELNDDLQKLICSLSLFD